MPPAHENDPPSGAAMSGVGSGSAPGRRMAGSMSGCSATSTNDCRPPPAAAPRPAARRPAARWWTRWHRARGGERDRPHALVGLEVPQQRGPGAVPADGVGEPPELGGRVVELHRRRRTSPRGAPAAGRDPRGARPPARCAPPPPGRRTRPGRGRWVDRRDPGRATWWPRPRPPTRRGPRRPKPRRPHPPRAGRSRRPPGGARPPWWRAAARGRRRGGPARAATARPASGWPHAVQQPGGRGARLPAAAPTGTGAGDRHADRPDRAARRPPPPRAASSRAGRRSRCSSQWRATDGQEQRIGLRGRGRQAVAPAGDHGPHVGRAVQQVERSQHHLGGARFEVGRCGARRGARPDRRGPAGAGRGPCSTRPHPVLGHHHPRAPAVHLPARGHRGGVGQHRG
jgi:hypothetical protein